MSRESPDHRPEESSVYPVSSPTLSSASSPTVSAVVFDLDGVVRHFDPDHRHGVEQRHGLSPGTLHRVAFAEPLITEVTTGVITRSQWAERIGDVVGAAPAREWLDARGEVDREVVALLDELASAPVAVALLTNGTDAIDRELVELELVGRFDAVFNSAVIGFRKPSFEVYAHVARELGVAPEEIWFTDDAEANVGGAMAAGWRAVLFTGAEAARRELTDLGPPAGGSATPS